MKQVICMKWGTLYGPEYVNRLYGMVRRNISGDLRFVCLTDETEGIRPEVELHPCPTVKFPEEFTLRGWRKLSLYAPSEKLYGLDGDWFYLDLDVIVTRSLDDFFTYQPEKSFIVMQNWTQPGKNIGNTSAYRFRVGADAYLLDLLESNNALLKEHPNSQTYISRTVKDLNFWPDEWCVLFKVQCVPPWPARFWKEPTPPDAARVIAFPGVPNPHEALNGEWPLRASWKRLYKYIRPATWIADYWKED